MDATVRGIIKRFLLIVCFIPLLFLQLLGMCLIPLMWVLTGNGTWFFMKMCGLFEKYYWEMDDGAIGYGGGYDDHYR